MLNPVYLSGLTYQPFILCPGFVAIADHRRSDSSRFICTYAKGRLHKENFFRFLSKAGQHETPVDWDLHHIVEGRHYADIDFRGELTTMYEESLPCVLIHRQDEHELYSRLMSIRATKELYLTQGLPTEVLARSRQVAQEALLPQNRVVLQTRLNKLINLYQNAYHGDYILQKIALNVLNDAAKRL